MKRYLLWLRLLRSAPDEPAAWAVAPNSSAIIRSYRHLLADGRVLEIDTNGNAALYRNGVRVDGVSMSLGPMHWHHRRLIRVADAEHRRSAIAALQASAIGDQ